MVCQTTPLAQHTLAGQAATRRDGSSLARVRPRQRTLATPWPLRACKCAGCSAVRPQWHTAPTKALKHTTRLRAATRWPVLASTHEERSVRARFGHRACTLGATQAIFAPHCTTLHPVRHSAPLAATCRCTPARSRRAARAQRHGPARARTSSESDRSARSSKPKASQRTPAAHPSPTPRASGYSHVPRLVPE